MAVKEIFDSLMKSPSFGSQPISSRGGFADNFFGASASFAPTPFAYGAFIGDSLIQTASCDAGANLDKDSLSVPRHVGSWNDGETLSENHNKVMRTGTLLENDYLVKERKLKKNILKLIIEKHENGVPKRNASRILSRREYYIPLKPLLSAFHWKNLALTSLRSCALFYLPLLEPRERLEDEDDDFLVEDLEEHHVDLVEPFKKSVKQIIRETSVVTTRRVLERFVVHYASQHVASKLLKDVPNSAIRKAERGMPTCIFCYHVSRTTFRGHLLGVVASWAVQVGLDIYGFCSSKLKNSKKLRDEANATEQEVVILRKKVCGATVRCVGSLVFASIGAGIGATLFRPSSGQKIGCILGDLAGPVIIVFCCSKLNWEM